MLEITGNIFARDSWSRKPITPEIALCVTTNGVVKASGQAVMGAGRKRSFPVVEDDDLHMRAALKILRLFIHNCLRFLVRNWLVVATKSIIF